MSSLEIASCEADVAFFAKQHDSDTRQWFFDNFDTWFRDPGDSRAYVLLGDPGVGKSVMAGVLAQRMRRTGHLGAAYFCRHNDSTRNDPRYLLGTVACQLCECNSQYDTIVGGEGGVRKMLGNSTLSIQELFTKLLQKPLAKCNQNQQRKLVIIDALDEREYESREDFLDLITHRFPLLPEWLVFFITSRPEDSVQFRLKKYNPCVKICAGDSDQHNFYQRHEQDIRTFLEKRIDFSCLSCTVEDIARKCHGLFLYAHYIVEELKLFEHTGKKLNQLSDLFPGDIDDFFLQNFTRVYHQVGQDLFKKLFGCAIVAPSPLPVSIISYILKRENSNHDEQRVIDAVSQFVVLRTSDHAGQTLTFLHNLIPAWLTNKNKASRKLFIDKKTAGEYLRKIFAEILSIVVSEPQPTCPSIDVDLEEYVSRVAIRFLCQFDETDSLKTVFSCLTSYNFMERRLLSGRIEIYRLLEDLKLASGRFPLEEVKKREILDEILYALESNVHVLLKCPHLLPSCIQNASNIVREAVLIPQVSAPLLQSNFFAFPDAKISDMHCFATSSDKRTVAGAKGRTLLFFDASTAETLSGPFEVSEDSIDMINQLEYSPDGKFIFFGRLDKWFSVERECVEDFPQFSGNSHVYQWGVFTRDGQSIVVKRSFSYPGTCQAKSCLFNLLALWALKETEQSRSDEMTVSFCPQVPCRVPGVQVERLFDRLGIEKNVDQTCETLAPSDPSCHYCCRLKELAESSQESSLAAVRQLVLELYPCIFVYQVWDLQAGMPVLQQVFSQGVQLNPFTYLCHVPSTFSERELKMVCSGIEKATSVCNIAVVFAVDCALLGSSYFVVQGMLERVRWLVQERKQKLLIVREQKEKRQPGYQGLSSFHPFSFQGVGRTETVETRFHLCLPSQELELMYELMWEMKSLQNRELVLGLKLEHVNELEIELQRLHWVEQDWKMELGLERQLEQEQELEVERALVLELKMILETVRKRTWEHLASVALFKEFHNNPLKFGVFANIPKAFQDLVYTNGDILWCASPEKNWIIEADGFQRIRILQTGNQEQQFCNYWKLEHTINKVGCFTFTNDDLYFVYSSESSLYALSLQTGALLTSVSGFNLNYFTNERRVGYFFSSDTEQRAIFLTSLSSPFKFLSALPVKQSVVGISIGAMFRSSVTVMSVSSNSLVTLWQAKTFADKEVIAFVSKSSLTKSPSVSQTLPLKNCVLSSDGKLIAIHQGTKVGLYKYVKSRVVFLHSVFESKCEFTIAYFAFSAGSTVLLFCIQDNRNRSHFYVWDIQKKVVSASFESPGFLDAECCCLSSNRQELILCGEYEIEIWEYAEHSCRFLTRFAVEKPYNSVKFSQCTVSLDNQFLVCCIADIILVYSLHSSDIHSSKQVLRGHLGRIEFCRFLKVNRYLISYGVDEMVFLWDLTEWKAVGFARITQDQDSILTMAVSPEEDKAVCFTSSGRVCVIKLCELGSALSLKPFTAPVKSSVETAKTRLPPLEQMPSASQLLTSSVEDDMADAMSISDSEEDFLDYYLEHDPLDESD